MLCMGQLQQGVHCCISKRVRTVVLALSENLAWMFTGGCHTTAALVPVLHHAQGVYRIVTGAFAVCCLNTLGCLLQTLC
jgi:hypothetical protein